MKSAVGDRFFPPDVWESNVHFMRLTERQRLLYLAFYAMADDFGRAPAGAETIAWTWLGIYDGLTAEDAAEDLAALNSPRFPFLFYDVNGTEYVQITDFRRPRGVWDMRLSLIPAPEGWTDPVPSKRASRSLNGHAPAPPKSRLPDYADVLAEQEYDALNSEPQPLFDVDMSAWKKHEEAQ